MSEQPLNDPRNPEGVIGNHDIFLQLQKIRNGEILTTQSETTLMQKAPQDIRNYSASQQLKEITLLLTDANNHGLLAEVVSTAISYHRTTPNAIPLQSIIIGYSEWVK